MTAPTPAVPASALPEPVLELDAVALDSPRGRVFGPVSLALDPGRLAVVHGPSGSGRSCLLLAASGRLAVSAGTGRVAGHGLASRGARQRVAVARIAGLVDLEPQLTVAESVVERSLTEGVPTAHAERAVSRCEHDWGCAFPRDTLVGDLDALDRTRLTLALALVRPADLVVLDDVDHDLDLADQQRLYAALAAVCATGTAVLVSTTDPLVIPADAVAVALPPNRRGVGNEAPTRITRTTRQDV